MTADGKKRKTVADIIITAVLSAVCVLVVFLFSTSDRNTLTLTVAGDLMCHSGQIKAAYEDGEFDFNYQFDHIRDAVMEGDIAIANFETNSSDTDPITYHRARKYGAPYLNSVDEYIDAVKEAGFDLMMFANNHNADTGSFGLAETIDDLNSRGLETIGAYKTKPEYRFRIIEENNIKLGIVNYTTFMNRAVRDFTEEEKENMLCFYDRETAEEDIALMKEMGAEYIIVYFHAGKEYTESSSPKQQRIAGELAEAGADYVICSHTHSVNEFDIIRTEDGRDVPVVYSLGNFVSGMVKNQIATTGLMMKITLEKKDGKVVVAEQSYYPLQLQQEDRAGFRKYQVLPLTDSFIDGVKDSDEKEYLKSQQEKVIGWVGDLVRPEK